MKPHLLSMAAMTVFWGSGKSLIGPGTLKQGGSLVVELLRIACRQAAGIAQELGFNRIGRS